MQGTGLLGGSFSEQQEKSLAEYLKTAADLFYGLSTKEVRRFAFQLAVHYHCNYPASWNDNSMASRDWFLAFMKRQPCLSIRCPQPTSLSRATSFNRHIVSQFFDNLGKVLDKHKFHAKDVWNMDETGVTTVQNPENIVARRGGRQFGSATSAERGTLVTLACAVNALRNMIPPHFVFPRVHFKEHFIRDGPPGCIGTANASGWMLEEDFIVFLKHFQHHTKSSVDAKVLLILDNHTSHLSLTGINFCRDNGIVLLSFPPHCSHKLQPLDRTVYGPLKRAVNSFCDSWMKSHPGLAMSIYEIPGIVRLALPLAATPANVQSGFRCTGIWPFNREVFQDVDFAPSLVTDHPPPSTAAPPVPSALPTPPADPLVPPMPSAALLSPAAVAQPLPPVLPEPAGTAQETPSRIEFLT
ncbi:uncharacterized protein si:rp71-1d10.8 [Hemibagrus wyckioides]|uniref:uncharacterized protein si:rp71-1d10.8 n=1 Tax=Hemibagrus wyckioides TaxID=337641 RepID=UPI00266D28E3|nr:uncharacterized protein si:rp71-1d10.8 [Hemibagrus wyckioides]